jgi:hypothetical protein
LSLLDLAYMSEGEMKRILITVVCATTTAVLGTIAMSQAASKPARSSKPVRFSVLRSAKLAAASSETALPALTEKHLTEPETLVSELELEPARASYVEIDATTHGWVIPGRKRICLAVATRISIVSGCGSLASADAGGLVMVQRPSTGPIIYGVVPDGATVTVTDTDGSSNSVRVTSNVFRYAEPTAKSVSVRAGGGSAVTTTVN